MTATILASHYSPIKQAPGKKDTAAGGARTESRLEEDELEALEGGLGSDGIDFINFF
jgi:hypothetical protein